MMRLWGELQEIIKVRMDRQELVKCLYPTEGHASTSDEKDTNKLVIFFRWGKMLHMGEGDSILLSLPGRYGR